MGIFRNAPPQLLREHYRRLLSPGTVVRFEAQLAATQKIKRWVVVELDSAKVTFFIINTRPAPFVLSRPAMAKCQAFMAHAAHPFMSRDCYVDCFRPRTFDLDDVLTEFVKDTLGNGVNPVLGKIAFTLRDAVVAKLLQSAATSPQQKTDFAASLNSMV